jgi:hypothetical protein
MKNIEFQKKIPKTSQTNEPTFSLLQPRYDEQVGTGSKLNFKVLCSINFYLMLREMLNVERKRLEKMTIIKLNSDIFFH